MKKIVLLILTPILFLVACSSQADATNNPDTGLQADPNTRELPLSTKLAIGTLKLEGTGFAIASDQAVELLPLWQVLNSLSASDGAAPEEITAITGQIQETMTAEQRQAIDEMALTPQNIFATMQELGLVDAARVNASGTPQPGAGLGGGQGPGGGLVSGEAPPGGGPGSGFGGGEISPEQMATAQARRAEGGGFGNRMLAPLAEAVIDLLESKIQ